MNSKAVIGFVTLMCVAAVWGEKGGPNAAACRTQLGLPATGKIDESKRPCFMACIGTKSGWLNADYTINVEKKMDWVNKSNMPADAKAKMQTIFTTCQAAGKGAADQCAAGTKIHDCIKTERTKAGLPAGH